MNELEFIREQVRLERQHMAEVRQALESALATDATLTEFCQSAARYLVFVVQRFNAQDQIHCDQLGPRLDPNDAANSESLRSLAATLARSRAAIAELESALGADAVTTLPRECRRYLQFYRTELSTRKNVLYPLLVLHYDIGDWRRASLVTADSILTERELYAAVQARLPQGVELKSAGRPASSA